MSRPLNREDFRPHLGVSFPIEEEGVGGTALVLAEVSDLQPSSPKAPRQEPFSLVFRGPALPRLPQRTYRLRHPGGQVIEIFLVPIQPDGEGPRYEAVFN